MTSRLKIIITLKNVNLDDEELEHLTQNFYRQMLNISILEKVERVIDTTTLPGQMGGSYLPGILKAEAEQSYLKDAGELVYERAGGKADLTIGNDTQEVTIASDNLNAQQFSEAVVEAGKQIMASASGVKNG